MFVCVFRVGVRVGVRDMFTRCSSGVFCVVNGCMWTCIRVSCVYSVRCYLHNTSRHINHASNAKTRGECGRMVKRRGECGKEEEERIERER